MVSMPAGPVSRLKETIFSIRGPPPSCGGTIYLCTADSEGNMVSWIQSNYTTFGAGVAVPGTGISFQNRGANFSLDRRASQYRLCRINSYALPPDSISMVLIDFPLQCKGKEKKAGHPS